VERPNVLLLDEPTNDLDLDTLRQLEDFLEEWPGALIVVSHDRAFLERTVADVLVLDGTSAGRRPGGYAAYEAERQLVHGRRRLAATGQAPATTPAAPAAPAKVIAAPAAPKGARRSPSTVRHQLRAAARAMAGEQVRHDELTAELAAAGSDHERLAVVAAELAKVAEELAAVEESWLELAAEAEEMGIDPGDA
jgi:ATP-binding cassette subfamily F protein uup